MVTDRVQSLDCDICTISEKSSWVFLRLGLSSGVTGLGEATIFGLEGGVVQKVRAFGQALRGLDIRDGMAWAEERTFREFDSLSQLVLSGIGQAMIDARA